MHHLRDSGNIEQDADLIMLAYREAYYLERQTFSEDPDREQSRLDRLEKVKWIAEINIAKQRSGMVGSNEYFCRADCNVVSDKPRGGW